MNWYEINVKTSENAIDAVMNILVEAGANGVMILNPNDPDFTNQSEGKWDYYDPQNISLDFEGVLVTAYVDKEDIEQTVDAIQKKVEVLDSFGLDKGLGEITYKKVNSTDWENEWKKYFKPFRLGSHMVVKPTWEHFDAKEDDVIIEIDPGNAFGSGTHETTSMCIEMVEKYLKPSDTVIDVGCGSGILGIAAGLLGAKAVTGVDIDETAVYTARDNFKQNGLAEIATVHHGNLIDVIEDKGNIVVANIIAEIIVMLADDVEKVMADDAYFIASGIILDKVSLVEEKLLSLNFDILEVIRKGEWAVIVSKKG